MNRRGRGAQSGKRAKGKGRKKNALLPAQSAEKGIPLSERAAAGAAVIAAAKKEGGAEGAAKAGAAAGEGAAGAAAAAEAAAEAGSDPYKPHMGLRGGQAPNILITCHHGNLNPGQDILLRGPFSNRRGNHLGTLG